LGYYEIDNYVFTDYYAGKTIAGFATACAKTIVKRAYFPVPQTKEEKAVFDAVKEIAKERDVDVRIFGKEIETESATVQINSISYVAGSSKRGVALFVDSGNSRFTYLSSGVFRTFDDTFYKEVSLSDVIVFGSSGPNYKMKYTYNTPYLDACVFLGNSKDFASKDFLKQVGSKDLTQDYEFYRFKLKATP
jgi:SAM-dependent MidA family methyltransferase